MSVQMTIIIGKRGGGMTCMDLTRIGNSTGEKLKQFERLDKEYGHSLDLAYALETNRFGFVEE